MFTILLFGSLILSVLSIYSKKKYLLIFAITFYLPIGYYILYSPLFWFKVLALSIPFSLILCGYLIQRKKEYLSYLTLLPLILFLIQLIEPFIK